MATRTDWILASASHCLPCLGMIKAAVIMSGLQHNARSRVRRHGTQHARLCSYYPVRRHGAQHARLCSYYPARSQFTLVVYFVPGTWYDLPYGRLMNRPNLSFGWSLHSGYLKKTARRRKTRVPSEGGRAGRQEGILHAEVRWFTLGVRIPMPFDPAFTAARMSSGVSPTWTTRPWH